MITMSKARAVIEALVKVRDLVTDEQAAEVMDLYPVWKDETTYEAGARILYNGILYKVLLPHTSQADWTPDVAPSLFAKVLIPDENTIYPWEQPDSTNLYMTGDKVSHNDKIWISTVDNNSWEPGIYGWEEYVETEEEPTIPETTPEEPTIPEVTPEEPTTPEVTPEEPTTTPEEENSETVVPDEGETGESTTPEEGNEEPIEAWEQPESTDPYAAGAIVTHNGNVWISTVDGNVWEPGAYGWEIVE